PQVPRRLVTSRDGLGIRRKRTRSKCATGSLTKAVVYTYTGNRYRKRASAIGCAHLLIKTPNLYQSHRASTRRSKRYITSRPEASPVDSDRAQFRIGRPPALMISHDCSGLRRSDNDRPPWVWHRFDVAFAKSGFRA